MPVSYTIDAKERLIRTRCVGMVTLAEVVDHFRELGRDAGRPECLDVLLDLSEVQSLPDAAQIRAVVVEVKKIQEKVRFGACAVVAVRDALFGMLRIFEVMAQRDFRAIRVFRALPEAEAWLVLQGQQSSQGRP